ncbi:MAG: LamG-like jellyroll fold domain-containing protein, partial [bacterium]|nr:LamG-like jellyroll fold domain-containing protein [bacterium]
VVIAIIGLLASIILVSLKGTREKARIAKSLDFSQRINHALGAYAVGIWRFDEGSGTIASDSSGYGNNGTLVNGPVWTTDSPSGKGRALSFDGVNDYVDAGNGATLQPNYVTLETWVKTTTTAGGRVAAHVGGGKYPYDIYLNPNGTARWEFDGISAAVSNQSGNKKVNDGNWHYITIAYDGSTGFLYVDGVLDVSIAYSGGVLEYNGSSFLIGKGGDGHVFNGLIDEVRIYNSALGITQIQKHYAEGLEKHQNLAKQ